MKTHVLVVLLALAAVIGAAPSTVRADEPVYTEAELDQMLAPVALYPDTVLTNVLIASTYPLQVVAAARWSAANSGLDAEAALAAVEAEDWDPAVKALVAFPDLLARMHDDLDWTQRIGDAFLAQQGDVLDRVQVLRSHAYDAGHLKSSEHVRVVRVADEREASLERTTTQTIVIEPVTERIVYVPVYDTRVVYGPWWWHAHPPVHWTWPGRHYSSVGLYWGRGIAVHPVYFHGSFHWHDRYVYYGGNRWHHRPRYHYNRPHNTRRPVERYKPPVRAGNELGLDPRLPRTRPMMTTTPRLSTSARPVRTAPRAVESRPAAAPARAASSTVRQSPAMSRQAPALSRQPAATRQAPAMSRQAPAMRTPAARPAPTRAAPTRSATPPVRGVPMSKPAPSPAARAPAAASAPRAAPARSADRAQPRRKQN